MQPKKTKIEGADKHEEQSKAKAEESNKPGGQSQGEESHQEDGCFSFITYVYYFEVIMIENSDT